MDLSNSYWGVVENEELCVFHSPRLDSPVKTQLKKGSIIYFYRQDGDFYEVFLRFPKKYMKAYRDQYKYYVYKPFHTELEDENRRGDGDILEVPKNLSSCGISDSVKTAQEIADKNNIYNLRDIRFENGGFTKVVKIDSVSKDDLFDRAQIWFANAFNDANEVVQVENREKGVIIGKGSAEYFGKDKYYNGWIKYNIEIRIKDGRYKIDMNNIHHDGYNMDIGSITGKNYPNFKAPGSTKRFRQREWDNLKSVSTVLFRNFVFSSFRELSQSIEEDGGEDW